MEICFQWLFLLNFIHFFFQYGEIKNFVEKIKLFVGFYLKKICIFYNKITPPAGRRPAAFFLRRPLAGRFFWGRRRRRPKSRRPAKLESLVTNHKKDTFLTWNFLKKSIFEKNQNIFFLKICMFFVKKSSKL